MRITALNEFGMDLTDVARTEELSQRIPPCPDSHLEIDLSGCILDYPATSKIIDAALHRLSEAPSPRRLVLTFNIEFQERMFVKWFFFGSVLLPRDGHKLEEAERKARLDESLRERNVKLSIRIVDPRTKNEMESFLYG